MPSPLIVLSVDGPTGPASGAGVSLETYRRRLADELGFSHVTRTTRAASGGEAARLVFAEELRDDEAGAELLGAPYLYVGSGPQAGAQRRMLSTPETGWQGPLGAVMLSRPLAAPLALATVVEVTHPLPVRRHLAVKGLTEVVNEALAGIPIPTMLELEGNGTPWYDVTEHDWLVADEQLRGVWGAGPTADGLGTTWRTKPYATARLLADGPRRLLATTATFGADQPWYLEALIPADRLVYDGSGWTVATTPGLQGDDWRAAARQEWVLAFGMVRALRVVERLLRQSAAVDPRERRAAVEDVVSRRKTWAVAAHVITTREFPRPIQERTAPLMRLVGAPAGAAAFTSNRD